MGHIKPAMSSPALLLSFDSSYKCKSPFETRPSGPPAGLGVAGSRSTNLGDTHPVPVCGGDMQLF